MKTRTLKVTLILLALLAGAAFAVGHNDQPGTGEDHECTCEPGEDRTCESPCEDCTCDSLSRARETSAPIEEIEATGCQGCPGHGCH